MELGTLTLAHLQRYHACSRQRDIFRNAFPRGFIPTEENFERAADNELNISWATYKILDKKTRNELFHEVENRYFAPRRMRVKETYQHSIARV